MADKAGPWKDYLDFLEASPYSLQLMTANLSPSEPISAPKTVSVDKMGYKLYPFQEKILRRMGKDTLVVGLPTGLGKTYLAGAFIAEESKSPGCRVLFLTPSVPLGVQQTLFARKMLGLGEACFISGSIPPDQRRRLKVWNAGFAVTTPQTFYNDVLEKYSRHIEAAKEADDPVSELSSRLGQAGFRFPYSLVIADECHGYIGETDGHAILLAAKASGAKILALSATPQLHAPQRLKELKRVFERVEAISVEEPEIKAQMPERLIVMTRLPAPQKLISIYYQLNDVIKRYQVKVARIYGPAHARGYCTKHGLCVCLIALKVMKSRIVEDGASSVSEYGTWKLSELKAPLRELGGKSIHDTYKDVLDENPNHKIAAAKSIIASETFKKAIIFVESVEAAKQMGTIFHKLRGMDDVAVLVGKGDMAMEQQASALLQFREKASILICTSIGEEGLDIPAADIEIWIDPPSNPKKWIQRFGRILRQSEGKTVAKTYALITMQTHEKNKLIGVKKKVEKVYGFTQRMVEEDLPKPLPKDQKRLSQFF